MYREGHNLHGPTGKLMSWKKRLAKSELPEERRLTFKYLRKPIADMVLKLSDEPTQQQMLAEEIQVDLVPQGTLVERIRAGGFGLGGILTPTGVGTVAEEGKRKIAVDGRDYLLETALRADFALVHAFIADYLGNRGYALTARTFNPLMAMAATTVLAQAENVVPVGVMAPDHVLTPAPVVDYLVVKG